MHKHNRTIRANQGAIATLDLSHKTISNLRNWSRHDREIKLLQRIRQSNDATRLTPDGWADHAAQLARNKRITDSLARIRRR